MKKTITILLALSNLYSNELPLYYWKNNKFLNFGDHLSKKIVEKMLGKKIKICNEKFKGQKILAIGSILTKANTNDIIWGSGVKNLDKNKYNFKNLKVHLVRGPLTRNFLINKFNINVPEIFGDPALLLPILFPEFKVSQKPLNKYLIIPHYSEKITPEKNIKIIRPTEKWRTVVQEILNSELVISGSLHGIIVAEAFGIPARWLRISENESMVKYYDYYLGTGRKNPKFAKSIEEAVNMGGEEKAIFDIEKIYKSFPLKEINNT